MAIDLLILPTLLLLLVLPGAPVALLLGRRMDLRWHELVPASVAATIVLWTPVLILALAFGLDVRIRIAVLGAIVVAGWGIALRSRSRAAVPARTWLGIDAWNRRDAILLALALVSGVLAYGIGGAVRSDALYHAAQALKLASLDSPSFSNTMSFVDQDIHPGYIVPLWHDIIGMTSLPVHRDVIQVMYVGGGVVAPVALLAFAMLAGRLWPARPWFPVAGAVTYMALALSTETAIFPWTQAMYPRQIATDVGLPVLIASFATAIRPVIPGDRRRWAWGSALACIGLVDVLVLHNSYVYLAGLLIGGLLLGRMFAGRAAAANVGKASAVVALAALLGTAVQYPVIANLQAFAQESAAGEATQSVEGSELLKGVKLGELLVGTPESFRLRTDHIVQWGIVPVLALLGGIAAWALLLTRRGREPGVWTAAGTCLLILLLTQIPPVFTEFVRIIGISQAKRVFQAMPIMAGVGTLWTVAMWIVLRLERRRLVLAVATIALCAGLVVLDINMRTTLFVDEPRISERAIQILGGTLVLLAAATLGRLLADRLRHRTVEQRELVPATSGIAHQRAFIASTTLLAVSALLPVAVLAWTQTDERRAMRTGSAMHQESLRDYQRVEAVLERNEGAVLLAKPEVAHTSMALAPVYVVGSVAGHNANTKKNRVYDRERLATWFFLPKYSDEKRWKLLDAEDVDLVLVYTGGMQNSALGFMQRHAGAFERVHRDSTFTIFRFHRNGDRNPTDA